jgi:hypothetical protein
MAVRSADSSAVMMVLNSVAYLVVHWAGSLDDRSDDRSVDNSVASKAALTAVKTAY